MSKTYFLFNNYNSVSIQSNIEIGYYLIQNQNQIYDPPKNQKRNDLYFINKAKQLMDKISQIINLDINDILTSENNSDGNCFFRVLSQFFY